MYRLRADRSTVFFKKWAFPMAANGSGCPMARSAMGVAGVVSAGQPLLTAVWSLVHLSALIKLLDLLFNDDLTREQPKIFDYLV